MIMTFAMSVVSLTLLWVVKAFNPVKVSVAILFVSILLFLFMFLSSGQAWMPTILMMLFMGGIIMMFMILSSIMPNEKAFKVSNAMALIFPLALGCNLKLQSFPTEKLVMENKSFFLSGYNFYFMMTIILLYFLMSMMVISTEDSPMRSMSCCKIINFVS